MKITRDSEPIRSAARASFAYVSSPGALPLSGRSGVAPATIHQPAEGSCRVVAGRRSATAVWSLPGLVVDAMSVTGQDWSGALRRG